MAYQIYMWSWSILLLWTISLIILLNCGIKALQNTGLRNTTEQIEYIDTGFKYLFRYAVSICSDMQYFKSLLRSAIFNICLEPCRGSENQLIKYQAVKIA